MYCWNCKKKILDDSKFCEYCGASQVTNINGGDKTAVTTPLSVKKKGKKPLIILGGIAGVLIVGGLAVFLYSKFSTKTIDLNDYVCFDCGGFNGEGIAQVWIDTAQISEDYGNYASGDISELCENCFSVALDNDWYLYNGDEVSLVWCCDDDYAKSLGFNLSYSGETYTISDLPEYTDNNYSATACLYADEDTMVLCEGEESYIRFTVAGALPNNYYLSLNSDNSIISFEWNDWVNDYEQPYSDLTVEGLTQGHEKLTVDLINADTGDSVNTIEVYIVVIPDESTYGTMGCGE